MMTQFRASLVILMADEDEDDCMLVGGALRECGLRNEPYFVSDGEKLMDYETRLLAPQPGARRHYPDRRSHTRSWSSV